MQKESLERQVLSKVIFNLERVRETSSDARNVKMHQISFISLSFLPRGLYSVVCALAGASVALLQDRLASRANDLLSDVVLVL